jgi:protein-S-isoprenylcysteine O-methyltransferase Ste14
MRDGYAQSVFTSVSVIYRDPTPGARERWTPERMHSLPQRSTESGVEKGGPALFAARDRARFNRSVARRHRAPSSRLFGHPGESMKPLPYVWPYALPFWAIFLWAFIPEWAIVRRARRTQGTSDAKSLQVILVGQSIAFFAAFPLGWVPALQFAPARRGVAFGVGVGVLVAGSLLRRHCWRMLGSSFTGDVRAHRDQQIVTRGAYRILRHPSYTAGIVLNTGVGIALGSWASAALLALSSLAVYLYRMTVEERALLTVIGDPYREFMRTRKRLIPFLY